MADHDNDTPISSFDEICHLTIETMRRMDIEELRLLKIQADHEFNRALMAKGCLSFVLSLKEEGFCNKLNS